jgi:hypothetical protein
MYKKTLENTEMYNPEKLATHGTQDEEQHNTICVRTTLRKQTNTNNINKTWALPQTTGGKMSILSCSCCLDNWRFVVDSSVVVHCVVSVIVEQRSVVPTT